MGRDFGIWDLDTLAEIMPVALFREHIAYYVAEDEIREELRVEAEVAGRSRLKGR